MRRVWGWWRQFMGEVSIAFYLLNFYITSGLIDRTDSQSRKKEERRSDPRSPARNSGRAFSNDESIGHPRHRRAVKVEPPVTY